MFCQAYVSLKTLKAVVYYVRRGGLCASTVSRHREKKRPQRRVKANGGVGYGVSIAGSHPDVMLQLWLWHKCRIGQA